MHITGLALWRESLIEGPIDNANLRLYANLDDLGKPNFKTHYDNLSAFYKKEGLKKMVKEFENQHDINFII